MTLERFLTLAKEILPWTVFKQVEQAIKDKKPSKDILEILKPVYIRKANLLRDLLRDETWR